MFTSQDVLQISFFKAGDSSLKHNVHDCQLCQTVIIFVDLVDETLIVQ